MASGDCLSRRKDQISAISLGRNPATSSISQSPYPIMDVYPISQRLLTFYYQEAPRPRSGSLHEEDFSGKTDDFEDFPTAESVRNEEMFQSCEQEISKQFELLKFRLKQKHEELIAQLHNFKTALKSAVEKPLKTYEFSYGDWKPPDNSISGFCGKVKSGRISALRYEVNSDFFQDGIRTLGEISLRKESASVFPHTELGLRRMQSEFPQGSIEEVYTPLISGISKLMKTDFFVPEDWSRKKAFVVELSESLQSYVLKIKEDSRKVQKERDLLKGQIKLLRKETAHLNAEIEERLGRWKARTVFCEECKAYDQLDLSQDRKERSFSDLFPTTEEDQLSCGSEEIRSEPEAQNPIFPSQDTEEMYQETPFPKEFFPLQKQLFHSIENLYKLLLFSEKEVSLGQHIRNLYHENQELRLRNIDLCEKLSNSMRKTREKPSKIVMEGQKSLYLRSKSGSDVPRSSLMKSELQTCLCGWLQSITITVYNMMKCKDQIEVSLAQFPTEEKPTFSQEIESQKTHFCGIDEENREMSKGNGKKKDEFLLPEYTKIERISRLSSALKEAETDKKELERMNKQATDHIRSLESKLRKLKKQVKIACERIGGIQARGKSVFSPYGTRLKTQTASIAGKFQALRSSLNTEETRINEVLETQKSLKIAVKSLLDALTDSEELTLVTSNDLISAIFAVAERVKTVQNGFNDSIGKINTWFINEPELGLSLPQRLLSTISDFNAKIPLLNQRFPPFSHMRESALRILTLSKQFRPEDCSRVESGKESDSLPGLLSAIELELKSAGTASSHSSDGRKSGYRGDRVVSRRSCSGSGNEKLFREEIESLERAKSEVQVQELLFELEQVRELQYRDASQISSLSTKNSELEAQVKSLRDRNLDLEAAIETLQLKLNSIKSTQLRAQNLINGEFVPTDVHDKLDELDESIKDLLIIMQNEKRETLLPKLKKLLLNSWKTNLSAGFLRWKSRAISVYPIEVWEEDPLHIWKLGIVRKNPLFESLALDDHYVKSPMPQIIVLKTLDEVMLKCAEKSVFSEMRSFPLFTIEYLTEKLGSRSSALKLIKQMIPGLLSFRKEEYYGQFLARILQIQNPFNDSISDFFLKLNFAVYSLVKNRLTIKREEMERFDLDYSESEFIDPGTGGKLFLSEALELVYGLPLAEDENLCRRVVNYLRGEEMEKTDYVMFVITHKMVMLNFKAKDLFPQGEKTQGLPLLSFIRTLKTKLRLCLSDKKLRSALELVARNPPGQVTLANFKRVTAPQLYSMNAVHDRYAIDRFYFLYALSFVYDQCVEHSLEVLMSIYESHSHEDGNTCFLKSLLSLEPDPTQCQLLLEAAKQMYQEEELTQEHFLNFVAERSISDYFRRPFIINITIEPEENEGSHKRKNISYGGVQTISYAARRLRNRSIIGVNVQSASKT